MVDVLSSKREKKSDIKSLERIKHQKHNYECLVKDLDDYIVKIGSGNRRIKDNQSEKMWLDHTARPSGRVNALAQKREISRFARRV